MSFIPLRSNDYATTDQELAERGLGTFIPGLAARPPLAQAVAQALFGAAEPEPPPPEPEPRGPDPAVLAALEQAFNEGRKAGREEARQEMMRLESDFKILGPLVEELRRARLDAVRGADTVIAELVLTLSRRIAGDTLAMAPDALPRLVTNAVERLPEDDEIFIRVPPSSVERIQTALGPRTRAKVVGDESVHQGCIVESRQSRIDATLEAAMSGVEAAVRSWLESRP
jgi:flagellar biosynthesis/type III secretory pathway protein FliH